MLRMRAATARALPRRAAPPPALLRLCLLAALLAVGSADTALEASATKIEHKSHKGKHKAASRRQRKAAFGESLEQATGGMCHYMESEPFQEFFSDELNISRWDERSMNGLFHCNRGTDEYVRAPPALRAACRCSLPLARACCAHPLAR
jgi:hypothetical protein